MNRLVTTNRKSPVTVDLLSDEEYRGESEKLQGLRGKLAGLERNINSISAAREREEQASVVRLQAATALLDGMEPPGAVPSHAQLAALYETRVITREAVAIQEGRLREIRARVSRTLCMALRPEYARIVKRLAAALTELSEALDQEHEFRAVLRDADIDFSTAIRPMGPLWVSAEKVGRVSDPFSNISAWLAEAKDHYGI